MKSATLFLALLFSCVSLSLFANPVIDSVGVKNLDGKKVILFKVKPKDTYYSIGRRYHVKPAAIMKFNGSKNETLTIGAIVRVPTDQPYKKSSKERVVKETKKEKRARLAREAKEEDKKSKKYTEEAETSSPVPQQDSEPAVKPEQVDRSVGT